MKGESHCEFFIIFRTMELPTINKLGLTQTEFSTGAKVTFHMNKYFSSEYHDFRNLTKLVWHFFHFSINFNVIMNVSAGIKK